MCQMSEQGFTIIKCLIFQFSCTLLPIIHISSPPFFGFPEFRTKAGVWSHSKAKGLFCCTASAVLLISFNQSFLSRRQGEPQKSASLFIKTINIFHSWLSLWKTTALHRCVPLCEYVVCGEWMPLGRSDAKAVTHTLIKRISTQINKSDISARFHHTGSSTAAAARCQTAPPLPFFFFTLSLFSLINL